MEMGVPHAPWPMLGQSVVGLARWRRQPQAPLAAGLIPMPGPWLLSGATYVSSPVGPFVELVVGRPARLGRHPGWCLVVHVVDSQSARVGSTLNWGFPSEVGSLLWADEGRERSLHWVDRGFVLRGRPGPVRLPLFMRVHLLQRRSDGPVFVPSSARGLARLARVTVETKDDDPLHPLAGPHPGVTVNGWHLRIEPARQALGLLWGLRPAPPRAPLPQAWSELAGTGVAGGGLAMVSPHPGRLAQR